MPIQFPDAESRLSYWSLHKPPGAPEEPVDRLIDSIESKNPGENWDDFVARIQTMQSHTQRASILTMAVPGDGKFEMGGPELDEVLSLAAAGWSPDIKIDIAPFLRWCVIAPSFQFLPVHHS